MKKRYILAIALAASMRLQAQTTPAPSTTFGPQQIISEGGKEYASVYAADLDGDGDQDILSTRYDVVAWYENNGQGSFGPEQVIASTYFGSEIIAADVDGDGDQDVVESASFSSAGGVVRWFANDGQGNFSEGNTIVSIRRKFQGNPGGFEGLDIADLDEDGDPDIVLTTAVYYGFPTYDNERETVWYENDGAGGFTERAPIATSVGGDVYASDLDGDGDADIVSSASGQTAWYANDGQGNFGPRQTIAPRANGAALVYAADLDQDGDIDVLSAPQRFSDASNRQLNWYANDGTGSFGPPRVVSSLPNGANEIYATDLDRDGDQDVLLSSDNLNGSQIDWYENDGQGNFNPQNITLQVPQASVYAADLDGDSDPDVLSASGNFSGKVAWYENLPSIEVIKRLTLVRPFDGSDLLTLQDSTILNVEAFSLEQFNLRANTITPPPGATLERIQFELQSPNTRSFTRSDFEAPYTLFLEEDGDYQGRPTQIGTYTLKVTPFLVQNGRSVTGQSQTVTFTFSENAKLDVPRVIADGFARDVTTADLDGDGDQDALLASAGSSRTYDNQLAWYVNDGQGNFGPQQIISTQADGALVVYAVDLDNDGDQDVLAAVGYSYYGYYDDGQKRVFWYENDGPGNFGAGQLVTSFGTFSFADYAMDVFPADIDGDGDQDVLSFSPYDKLGWYENDGQGNFGEPQTFGRVYGYQSLVATDLDGDGDQDVVAASYEFGGLGRVIWYENDGNGNFERSTTLDTGKAGRPNTGITATPPLAVADIDGDNDPDILTTAELSDETTKLVWYDNVINDALSVERLTLIRPFDNSDLLTLRDGTTINVDSLSLQRFDVRADLLNPVFGSAVRRVQFELTGPVSITRSDFAAPYALFREENGNYQGRPTLPGTYTLTVTPFITQAGLPIQR